MEARLPLPLLEKAGEHIVRKIQIRSERIAEEAVWRKATGREDITLSS